MAMPESALKAAFPPIVDGGTRVLLLGSLPGVRSLAEGQYYAHPGNGFWWLMGGVLGEPGLSALSYEERLARLRARGIGLWDVIASARREGSLDAAIRDPTDRALADFAVTLPQLRAIAFNGGTAARRGRALLQGQAGRWALIDLPSSSGAYASLPRAVKLEAWRAIAAYL